jgi:hypothetical protein
MEVSEAAVYTEELFDLATRARSVLGRLELIDRLAVPTPNAAYKKQALIELEYIAHDPEVWQKEERIKAIADFVAVRQFSLPHIPKNETI